MTQTDEGESGVAVARDVLDRAGVEPTLVGRLHNLRPTAVVSMAALVVQSLAEANGNVSTDASDIAATDRWVRAALVEVFVADALQNRELDATFGPHEQPRVTEVIDRDERDARLQFVISRSGEGREPSRPKTATMMILGWLTTRTEFRSVVCPRLKEPLEGGGRQVDLIKAAAAVIAATEESKTAVGAAA